MVKQQMLTLQSFGRPFRLFLLEPIYRVERGLLQVEGEFTMHAL